MTPCTFTKIPRIFCAGLFFWLLAGIAPEAALRAQDLQAAITLDKQCYALRDTVVVALHVTIPDKYHLYSNPLGPGIGKPAAIRVYGDTGIRWIVLLKSKPKRFYPEIGDWVWAYESNAYFFLKAVVDSARTPALAVSVYFDGLVCSSSCVPVNAVANAEIRISSSPSSPTSFDSSRDLIPYLANAEPMEFRVMRAPQIPAAEPGPFGQISLENLPVAAVDSSVTWDYEPLEKKRAMNFVLAVLLGFIAGIILNVMPCVLPVLGIKILSFANAGIDSRRTVVLRSLAFAGGMMLVFMALAAFASFAHLSWGQQFQSPWFLISLIAVTVIFALGLFDVYVFTMPDSIASMERASGKGYLGEFARGIFATLLATPCSGPFLGATLAWTLMQSTLVIFIVFASIGAGMAFPYVALSASSTLARLIPKPGKWMEDLKHLMGILLLASAVYFLLGLPKDMVVSAVGFSICVAFAVVFFCRFAPFGSSLKRSVLGVCCAALIAAAGGYLCFGVLYKTTSAPTDAEESSGIQWEDFSPALLRGAHANGRHVVVDFTANWCLNCQYNAITVLSSETVVDLIRKKNVLTLKADLTWTNAAAESLLHELGSRSVPFFAVFPGDDPFHPIIMRDILNQGTVVKVLKKLKDK